MGIESMDVNDILLEIDGIEFVLCIGFRSV